MSATRELVDGYVVERSPDLFGMGGEAWFSEDYQYRYSLSRRWGPGRLVAFQMLNPSKAGAGETDPTCTRCVNFARAWGYGAMMIANLAALIATDPRELRSHPDPVGPGNDEFIIRAAAQSAVVVAAWGAHPLARERGAKVTAMLAAEGVGLRCLGVTKDGYPRHPLHVRGDAELTEYDAALAGLGGAR